jgi:hypothetical protein
MKDEVKVKRKIIETNSLNLKLEIYQFYLILINRRGAEEAEEEEKREYFFIIDVWAAISMFNLVGDRLFEN